MSQNDVTVSSLIAATAKAKGIDDTRAGKLVRSRLRANYAALAKSDSKRYGPKGTLKRKANDGNRWTVVPRSFAAQTFPALVKPATRKRTQTPQAVAVAPVPEA